MNTTWLGSAERRSRGMEMDGGFAGEGRTDLQRQGGVRLVLYVSLIVAALLPFVGCSSPRGYGSQDNAVQAAQDLSVSGGKRPDLAGRGETTVSGGTTVPGEAAVPGETTVRSDSPPALKKTAGREADPGLPVGNASELRSLPGTGAVPVRSGHAALESFRRPNPESGWFANEVPDAPMGKPSARKLPPRKNDPELASVVVGKRKVARHDLRLRGGVECPDTLARRIVQSVRHADREGLLELMIDQKEYTSILWPEFPQSRPATNWSGAEAWFFHEAEAESGIGEGLDAHEGSELVYESVTCDVGRAPYTNFTLYHGIHVHAHTQSGEPVTMSFAGSFVECKGSWKVYIYED